MEAKELRIGNNIFVNGELQEVVDLPLPENCTSENTFPIPLTEEWLLKFGFRKYDMYYDVDDFYLIRLNDASFRAGSLSHLKMTHVHQLQNLYFALTGGELTLNQ